MVCKIPYVLFYVGLENIVGAVPNPFYALLFFATFPIFYAIPLSQVCAELATGTNRLFF